jgi:hypothetical protein
MLAVLGRKPNNMKNLETPEIWYLENEAFKARLPTLLQSKDRPSAFHSWGGGVMYEQVSSGICQDITKAASEGGFKDTFYPATIQNFTVDGKIYGLPNDVSCRSSSGTIKSCARKPENKHYGGRMSDPGIPPNGLRPDQAAKEGSDQFIQEDRYFSTYATYFAVHPGLHEPGHRYRHGHASERV